jgi:hypothetical protein
VGDNMALPLSVRGARTSPIWGRLWALKEARKS